MDAIIFYGIVLAIGYYIAKVLAVMALVASFACLGLVVLIITDIRRAIRIRRTRQRR